MTSEERPRLTAEQTIGALKPLLDTIMAGPYSHLQGVYVADPENDRVVLSARGLGTVAQRNTAVLLMLEAIKEVVRELGIPDTENILRMVPGVGDDADAFAIDAGSPLRGYSQDEFTQAVKKVAVARGIDSTTPSTSVGTPVYQFIDIDRLMGWKPGPR